MEFTDLKIAKTANGTYLNVITDTLEEYGLVVSKDNTSLSTEDAIAAIKEEGKSCLSKITIRTTKDGTRKYASLNFDVEDFEW